MQRRAGMEPEISPCKAGYLTHVFWATPSHPDHEWLSHAHDPKTCVYGFPTLLAVGTTEQGKVQLSLERHLHNRGAMVWGWEGTSAVEAACSV